METTWLWLQHARPPNQGFKFQRTLITRSILCLFHLSTELTHWLAFNLLCLSSKKKKNNLLCRSTSANAPRPQPPPAFRPRPARVAVRSPVRASPRPRFRPRRGDATALISAATTSPRFRFWLLPRRGQPARESIKQHSSSYIERAGNKTGGNWSGRCSPPLISSSAAATSLASLLSHLFGRSLLPTRPPSILLPSQIGISRGGCDSFANRQVRSCSSLTH